jgi:uncharacterized protein YrrD
MRLSFSKLKKLRVETKSGVHLGSVHDVVFDIDSHIILQYKVRNFVIGKTDYIINREQVISFDDNKIVVEDNISKEEKTNPPTLKLRRTRKKIDISPEPLVVREKI